MVCLLGVSAMAAGESRHVGRIVKMDSDKITLQDGDLETVTETQLGGGGQPPKAGQKLPAMPKQSAADHPSKSVRHIVFIANDYRKTYSLHAEDASRLKVGDIISYTTDGGKISKAVKENVYVTKAADGIQGSSAETISKNTSITGKTFSSNQQSENALRVDGAAADLHLVRIDKASGESGSPELGDFYGINAGFLATNGALATIRGSYITTNARGGNGVFSYGSGTAVNISESFIHTFKDNSGGLQTTGGGTMNANKVRVITEGNSAAAIRSDRGGGFVRIRGGSYRSNGYNSPGIYSTAKISADKAKIAATNSEALVIEGKNSISLKNCRVSGNQSKTRSASKDINVHNVMIYQSMSGDAEQGLASFSMEGGSLLGRSGDLIYVTNTDADITLDHVLLDNEDKSGKLLVVAGNNAKNGWGTAGKNGARVNFTARNQKMQGDITVDTISSLNFKLTSGSVFTGTIHIIENEAHGEAAAENAVVKVEKGSTWNLTGDCTLTSLDNQGTIHFNGHTITLADGTVLHG